MFREIGLVLRKLFGDDLYPASLFFGGKGTCHGCLRQGTTSFVCRCPVSPGSLGVPQNTRSSLRSRWGFFGRRSPCCLRALRPQGSIPLGLRPTTSNRRVQSQISLWHEAHTL